MELEPVIGLETHVQLKTKSKMFCSCDNTGEGKPANTTVCPICMGHPGTLPWPNAEAIIMAIKAAVALNLKVNTQSKFDRKNYFYPDLPKGYQISQYDEPLAQEGYLEVETKRGISQVGIERLHLEEDTAKLIHNSRKSLVDFNRAGTPLMEIVTNPDIKTPEEARAFLQELRLIMRYIGASDADMEKGHLRCDANISLRPQGEDKLYPKTEIKNLNSFRAVEKALTYEIKRQEELWKKKEVPQITSTRGWDEAKNETVAQREKEAVHDYRYFPEPDIPPLLLKQEEIDKLREQLPELPADKRKRWQTDYGLRNAEARLLTEDKALGNLVEIVVTELAPELEGDKVAAAKLATNWIIHKLPPILNQAGKQLNQLPFTTSQFGDFLQIVVSGSINSTNAQKLLAHMVVTGKDPNQIVQEEDLAQLDQGQGLVEAVTKVIKANPEQVQKYQAGKTALVKFFVGLVMRETKGKVEPRAAEEELVRQLGG